MKLTSACGTERTYQSKRSFVRFWGEADMARPPLAYRPVADDPTETWAALGFCSAKALFVPSSNRDIFPLLHGHYPPGRFTCQSTSNAKRSFQRPALPRGPW